MREVQRPGGDAAVAEIVLAGTLLEHGDRQAALGAPVGHDQPGEAASERLVLSLDDGEGGPGVEIGWFALEVLEK